jgi:hypothetical protein
MVDRRMFLAGPVPSGSCSPRAAAAKDKATMMPRPAPHVLGAAFANGSVRAMPCSFPASNSARRS